MTEEPQTETEERAKFLARLDAIVAELARSAAIVVGKAEHAVGAAEAAIKVAEEARDIAATAANDVFNLQLGATHATRLPQIAEPSEVPPFRVARSSEPPAVHSLRVLAKAAVEQPLVRKKERREDRRLALIVTAIVAIANALAIYAAHR